MWDSTRQHELCFAILLLGGCGGSAASVSEPDGELVADNQDVTGLATDVASLYWTTRDGSVMELALTGMAEPSTLLSGIATTPSSIAIEGGYIYWTNLGGSTPGQGAVMRIAADSGTPEVLAASQDFTHGIAVDATSVYWATYNGISTTSVTGGSVVPILDDGAPDQVGSTAIDSQYIYWTRGSLYRSALVGGTPQPVSTDTGWGAGIAVDETSVYWTVGPQPCDTPKCISDRQGYVQKAPKVGGASTMLAAFETPEHPFTQIGVDAAYVYWTTAHEVQRTPLEGGAIETLASGQGDPYALLVAADYVYWASGPVGSYPAAIRRVPK